MNKAESVRKGKKALLTACCVHEVLCHESDSGNSQKESRDGEEIDLCDG